MSANEDNAKIDVDLEAHRVAKLLAQKSGASVKVFVSELIKREAKGSRVPKKRLVSLDYGKPEANPYAKPPFWQGRRARVKQ